MGAEVETFRVRVSDAAVDDLRARLARTRWPERETGPGQGIGLDRLRALCQTWGDAYDWNALERRLNAYDQSRTVVDGLGIHVLHTRSAAPYAVPLLLTHGWPGSVVEYLDVLEPLTAAGFHCVVPSLPGYGWSERPSRPGWTVERVADAWAVVMTRLGHDRFLAAGTDWGTSVTACLGARHPDRVLGVHLLPPLVPSVGRPRRPGLDQEDGYSTEQRTRPQTIGYALVDSPVALAGWLGEKLDAWTDPRHPLTDTQVLDGVSVYWFTGTGAAAARLYHESLAEVNRWLFGPLGAADRVDVPTGCSVFPYELQQPTPEEAAVRFPDIRHWGTPERGGHFPAWEQPELFVAEVTAFADVLG